MEIDEKAEEEIHRIQIYITKAVFDLCSRHGIKCFLVGGSLLGAVKEHGILKGDKDVDIGMLREDYEKFCEFASELPDNLIFLESRREPSYNWLFSKVYQKGTRLIPKENTLFGPITGIYVDINPYDFVSENENKREREYKRAKIRRWLLLSKEKTNKKFFVLNLIKILALTQSREKLINFFSRGQVKTELVLNVAGGSSKDWFTMEEISNVKLVSLNGYEFNAPVWERYLDINYPDWQKKDMSRSELEKFEVEYE